MRLLVATIVLCCAIPMASAKDPYKYQLKSDWPLGSTRMMDAGAKSPIPFDKPYGALTPEQQARIKANYEAMGAGDEPPYPLDGTKGLFTQLMKASDYLREYGELRIVVDVDAAGSATAAHVFSTPGKPTSDFMSAVLLKERYKPALCAGTPCPQQFLFAVGWTKK